MIGTTIGEKEQVQVDLGVTVEVGEAQRLQSLGLGQRLSFAFFCSHTQDPRHFRKDSEQPERPESCINKVPTFRHPS